MSIFVVYRREADTCGNEDFIGPLRYVEANNVKEVEEVFPKGVFVGYYIKEIEIETIAWIRIQEQLALEG